MEFFLKCFDFFKQKNKVENDQGAISQINYLRENLIRQRELIVSLTFCGLFVFL